MVEEDSREKTDSYLAGAGSGAGGGGGAGASTSGTAQISNPNQSLPSRAFETQGHPNSELVHQVHFAYSRAT